MVTMAMVWEYHHIVRAIVGFWVPLGTIVHWCTRYRALVHQQLCNMPEQVCYRTLHSSCKCYTMYQCMLCCFNGVASVYCTTSITSHFVTELCASSIKCVALYNNCLQCILYQKYIVPAPRIVAQYVRAVHKAQGASNAVWHRSAPVPLLLTVSVHQRDQASDFWFSWGWFLWRWWWWLKFHIKDIQGTWVPLHIFVCTLDL